MPEKEPRGKRTVFEPSVYSTRPHAKLTLEMHLMFPFECDTRRADVAGQFTGPRRLDGNGDPETLFMSMEAAKYAASNAPS